MATSDTRSPQSDPAVFRLHSDVLCLIFSAALDEVGIPKQRRSLALLLAITHVCRRWRTVALAYANLWRKFFWDAGDSVEAALAFLERSGGAPLTISVVLEQWRTASIVDGLSAFRAASAHFARVTKLDLCLSEELISDQNISYLFGCTPVVIPKLRDLTIEVLIEDRTDLPRFNIASPSLVSLYLKSTLPLSWGTILSPSTRHVTLRSLVIQCADLHRVLELTRSLHTLSLILSRIAADEADADTTTLLPADAAAVRSVDSLHLYNVTGQSLNLLQVVIPVATQIREVILDTTFSNTPGDIAFDFLRIDCLKNITSLRLAPGDFSVSAADGLVRTIQGELTDELLESLCDLVMARPILDTLREVTVCISKWDGFLWLVFGSHTGNTLLALERVVLLVGEDRFTYDDGHEPSVQYSGPPVLVPRWTTLEVVVDGREPPTVDLVYAFLRARGSLKHGSSGHITVNYVNRDDMQEGEEDYRATFVELCDAEMARIGIVAND